MSPVAAIPDIAVAEMLRDDDEFQLLRGRRTGDNACLLIKTPILENAAPGSLKRFEHEFAVRAELDPSWAVMPLEQVRFRGRDSLLYADPGGQLLARIMEKPLGQAESLRIAIGIAAALDQLHKRNLIHKNIEPANILVDSATGAVHLLGFGIVSRLPRERQEPEPPEVIEGSLAYMAPEQTGRLNRSIDSRSDLYSLGVTLYELFTGHLPFTARDPMEWIHCHIARLPAPLSDRRSGIPSPISQIVLRLLAKNAEERYQTAKGVESDLRRCLQKWETQGRIEPFRLGQDDASGRMRVPEKLYGREREVQEMLGTFARVEATGRPEMVLVSGYSGIGKSSLVHELHKDMLLPRGLFASGKFNQYERGVPYNTFAQAFRTLLRKILSMQPDEIGSWKESLRNAVGSNGRLIADLIPEFELIAGKQPPIPELPPQEAQNRFHAVFRDFIGAFSGREHPLVLFLDDLQWCDATSLNLLEHLATHPEIRYLLLIGAYRDNEVGPAHPLMLSLDSIRKAGVIVTGISLSRMSREDVRRMVAETLRCDLNCIESLAGLVDEKTAGNPFFVIQFLHLLNEEELVVFDAREKAWKWDVERIRAKGFTDNVADLMVEKLKRLPAPTLEVMKRAACLGNTVDAAMLARILGRSVAQVHEDLLGAIMAGMVLRTGDAYRFLHDRVQEAAYSLIPEALRAEEHLRIGRLLRAGAAGRPPGEDLFTLVGQFNRGIGLVADREEKDFILFLNAVAGRKARTATAYEHARGYLSQAEALLPPDAWEEDYPGTFELALELAECEYLAGDYAAADGRFNAILGRARSNPDRARVHRLRSRLYQVTSRYHDALRAGFEGLALFGEIIPWSDTDIQAAIQKEILEVSANLGGRSVSDLLDAPAATDPAARIIIELTGELFPPALISRSELCPLIVLKSVNYSLKYGNIAESCHSYAYYGIILSGLFNDTRTGWEFCDLALRLNEKFNDARQKGPILLIHGLTIRLWRKSFESCIPFIEESFAASLNVGDLVYAGYIALAISWLLFETGRPLDAVIEESRKYEAFARQSRNETAYQTIREQQQFFACLKGLTRDPAGFDDDAFSEAGCLAHMQEARFDSGLVFHYEMKLIAAYMLGRHEEALEYSLQAQARMKAALSTPMAASWSFYHALTLAALFSGADVARKKSFAEALDGIRNSHKLWADNCPENFLSRYALISAEVARIEGRDLEAMRLYEQAIRSARKNGFLHIESLAHEISARFYSDRGLDTLAEACLRNARSAYLGWGALGKVRDLESRYPGIEWTPASKEPGAGGAPVARLDLLSVVKAAQAVSGEMVLADLVRKLLTITIEHAGAERGLLLLAWEGGYLIEAEAVTRSEGIDVRLNRAAIQPGDLPESIFHFTIRTRERVLLDDASMSNPFSEDGYLRRMHPRSVLCLPLVKQAKLVGTLYLENRLVPSAFTPDRIAVLDVLATQAAISLENARLYDGLQRAEDRFSKAFRNSPAPMAITRQKDDTFVDVNERFRETFGFPKEEFIGHFPLQLGIIDQAQMDKARGLIAERGSFHDLEFTCRTKEGKSRSLLTSAESIELDGEPCSLVTYIDVTDRKAVEEQLRQSQKMEAIGRLAGGVAHDFNNLLTAINGFSSMALEGMEPSHPRYDYLREVIKSGERAAVLTRQLLAHSRKQILHPEAWDLNVIIKDLFPMLKRLIAEDVDLGTDLSPDLGLTSVDRGQVEQVLLNLVINARDAMPNGGKLTLETRNVELDDAYLGTHLESAPGPHVMLAVSDTGTGMTPEVKARLFEPFFTTKGVGKGTGLGLSVVYGIVKQSGGSLSVYSEPGMGTIFRIYFPVSAASAKAGQGSQNIESPKSHRGDETILLAEDAESVRKFAGLALRVLGYKVLEAENGKEALEAMETIASPVHLLITDVVMPEMGGIELAARLRKRYPDLPILFVSGYFEHAGISERIIEAGESILAKPFRSFDLAQRVREILDGAARKRQVPGATG